MVHSTRLDVEPVGRTVNPTCLVSISTDNVERVGANFNTMLLFRTLRARGSRLAFR